MKTHFLPAFLLALVLAGTVNGQTANEPALPYAPSLDLSSMDKSIDPCVNFYHYACGGWRKKNPIPADQTSWSVYGRLYQDNLTFLRGILEQAASMGASRGIQVKPLWRLFRGKRNARMAVSSSM